MKTVGEMFPALKKIKLASDEDVAEYEAKKAAENDGQARCPKCGSTSLTGNKKGFGLGKGAVGAVVLGPVGILAAGAGKNKVIVTCMKCGHQWKV